MEHPEVVSQRILRYAEIDRARPGDGGVGLRLRHVRRFWTRCIQAICWAKMRTLAEGAAMATKKLWGKAGSAN